jgi:hypothetical protein
MQTLITKENKPKVRKVIGKEIRLRMGLTKVLRILMTNATIMAVI